MKIRVVDGLILEADKAVSQEDNVREWLGIIELEPSGTAPFFGEIANVLQHSKNLYDCAAVANLAARGVAVDCVDNGKLPCVEIDFPDDLVYARALACEEKEVER